MVNNLCKQFFLFLKNQNHKNIIPKIKFKYFKIEKFDIGLKINFFFWKNIC